MPTKSKKIGIFHNPKVVHEFDSGHKIVHLDTEEDLIALGHAMHHCAGQQQVWTIEEKIWYFFCVVDPNGKALNTIHLKQASWMGKAHPRDGQPKTGPIRRCNAYDHQINDRYYNGGYDNFEDVFGCRLPARMPAGVDPEIWAELVKAHKGVSDNYKKNVGAVKTVGRRVKFDGKYCIVLSDGIYGQDANGVKKYTGEWLNSLGKKKETNGS